MAKKFLSPLNLLNLTADPGTATEGDIYWNSTDNKLRVYYNGAWADASSGSGGVAYVAQTSAPTSTDVLWIDTDEPDVLYTAGDGLSSAGLELSVDSTVARTNASNTFTNNQLISANTSGNALEIRQIGAGNAFVVEDSANPDASPFVIDATGNVGIGTTTPAATLDVNGSVYAANDFAAGKNKILNSNFAFWQRGTSGFGLGGAYNSDRWAFYRDGSGATDAVTQQSFTAGAAPVAGYESPFFWRYSATVAGTGGTERSLYQRIEDVRTFANQTVTLSFWAKADATRTITLSLTQNFGSGGSASVTTSLTSQSVTTSWARYSATVAIPSISGKTIGTSSYLQLVFGFPVNVTETIDIWGVQLEPGSVATPFNTATGNPASELAACMRYYERFTSDASYGLLATGKAYSTTRLQIQMPFKVPKRVIPSSIDTSAMGTFLWETGATTGNTPTSVVIATNTTSTKIGDCDVTATGFTVGAFYIFLGNNNTNAYVGWNAEL